MSNQAQIATVDATNVDDLGFFCCKSKPKAEGYRNKLAWLRARMAEGLRIKLVYEGKRSMGFVEYMPGELAWRTVEATGYLLIHCLWVVGRGKGKGYGSLLLDQVIQDARRQGARGVAVVSSRGNWLANERVFLKNGFASVATAAPSFNLLVRPFDDGPVPRWPTDWAARQAAYGPGATVVYTDQCPYVPDAVAGALQAFRQRGIDARAVKLEDVRSVRDQSPSPYGVFAVVLDGRLFCYHYLTGKELRHLG